MLMVREKRGLAGLDGGLVLVIGVPPRLFAYIHGISALYLTERCLCSSRYFRYCNVDDIWWSR